MPIGKRLAVLLLNCLAAACTASAPGETAEERLVDEQWHLELDGRIGSLDDVIQSLTRVGQVLIGPEEELYVSQPDDGTVRVYDSRGALVRTIGRRGKGPGEFALIWHIGLKPDTLYVSDLHLGRVSFFSLTGDFLGSMQWSTELSTPSSDVMYFASPPQVLLDDGTGLLEPDVGFRPPLGHFAPGVHPWASRTPFIRIDRNSRVLDTLVWNERKGTILRLEHEGGVLSFRDPFDDSPIAQLVPDGSGVVVVRRSSGQDERSAAIQVTVIGPKGDIAFSRVISFLPVPRSPVNLRLALEQSPTTRFPPADAGQGHDPPMASMERALHRADLLPATLPPVTGLSTGQDGSIWLRREYIQQDSVVWLVIHRNHVRIARLTIPPQQMVVAAAGDLVVTVELDSLDVPYLVRYRVRRGE